MMYQRETSEPTSHQTVVYMPHRSARARKPHHFQDRSHKHRERRREKLLQTNSLEIMEETSRKRRWKGTVLTATALSVAASALVFTSNLDVTHTTSHNPESGRRRLNQSHEDRELAISCTLNQWHVSIIPSEFDTCTNSHDYPEEWTREGAKELMLHSNSEKCCRALEEMNKVECKVVDVCADSSGSKAGKENEMATASTATETTTTPAKTNKLIFYPVPQSGLCLSDGHHTSISPQFHFSTPEECCNSGWLDYNSCLSLSIHALYAAVPTTNTPSMAPNTDFPTWNPTVYDCRAVNKIWHMSTTKLFSCTNDGDYPKEWVLEAENYLFLSAEQCCMGRFPGLVCTTVDTCRPTPSPTRTPTKRPTPVPTKSPTKDPSFTYPPTEAPVSFTRGECTSNQWHMSRSIDGNVCTNDKDYPETWNHETLRDFFLMDSPEKCCEQNYFGRPGKECQIYDICYEGTDPPTDRPTTSPTPLPTRNPLNTEHPTSRPPTYVPTRRPSEPPVTANPLVEGSCGMWHPSTGNTAVKSCTNGKNDYPSVWDEFGEESKSKVFFDSAEKCCMKYWSLSSCPHTDYCVGGSPGGRNDDVPGGSSEDCGQWHPGTGDGPKSCSNGKDDYPKSWDNLPQAQIGTIFFDSADACCQTYWKQSCEHNDQCPGGSIGQGVNSSSGNDPIDSGPTQDPPASNDSCGLWHPGTGTLGVKTCSNGKDDYPKSWDGLPNIQKRTVFFDSADICCQTYWKQSCQHEDRCAGNSSNETPLDNGTGGSDPVDNGPGETPVSVSCGLWHPTSNAAAGVPVISCSNGLDDYPKSWDSLPSVQKSTIFHDDAEACCTSYWGKPCSTIEDKCAVTDISSGTVGEPSKSTEAPTNKPTDKLVEATPSIGDTVTSLGMDDFEDSSSSFPWKMGNPPQWEVTNQHSASGTYSIVNIPATGYGKGPGSSSTLTLTANLSQSSRFKCSVLVDIKMPFDWFSLRVNGKVKYPYYTTSGGQWTTFGTALTAGENLIELVVENGPTKPSIDRTSEFGSGYVRLDNCEFEQA